MHLNHFYRSNEFSYGKFVYEFPKEQGESMSEAPKQHAKDELKKLENEIKSCREAGDVNTPLKRLEALAGDKSPAVRETVAKNRAIPEKAQLAIFSIMSKLDQEQKMGTGRAFVENPAVSPKILEMLFEESFQHLALGSRNGWENAVYGADREISRILCHPRFPKKTAMSLLNRLYKYPWGHLGLYDVKEKIKTPKTPKHIRDWFKGKALKTFRTPEDVIEAYEKNPLETPKK